MLRFVTSGAVDPTRLITDRVTLEEGTRILMAMGDYEVLGVVVIEPVRVT